MADIRSRQENFVRSDVRTSEACRSELVERIRQRQKQQSCFARRESTPGSEQVQQCRTFNPFEQQERVRIRVFEGKNSLKGRVPQLLQAPHFLLKAREQLRPPYEVGVKDENGYRGVVLDALRAKHPTMIRRGYFL